MVVLRKDFAGIRLIGDPVAEPHGIRKERCERRRVRVIGVPDRFRGLAELRRIGNVQGGKDLLLRIAVRALREHRGGKEKIDRRYDPVLRLLRRKNLRDHIL